MSSSPIYQESAVSSLPMTGLRPARLFSTLVAGLAAIGFASGAAAAETEAQKQSRLDWQRAEYEAVSTKTIIELQQFRSKEVLTLKTGETVTLTNLNPTIRAWFLLEVKPEDGGRVEQYHIENSDPFTQTIALESTPAPHILIDGGTSPYRCIPWTGLSTSVQKAHEAGLPFSPICGGRLFVRNKVRGSKTNLEATSEFLRDNVWMGEDLVGFVKDTFFKDSHLETAEEVAGDSEGVEPVGLVRANLDHTPIVNTRTGMGLTGAPDGRMRMGSWYPVADLPGVYLLTMQPDAVSQALLRDGGTANRLDGIEGRAQAYIVSFDMTQFNLGYEVGTDHPRLDWSSRPSGAGRNYNIPGPDGIRNSEPLNNLGMVAPSQVGKTVGTFTGGFKRDHGAWRFGPWASQNNGTHYGFIVNGVVESKLQPELATLFVLDDGTIGMKSWAEEDNALIPRIRFARQNGVPLVVRDPATGKSMPGPMVQQWGAGNWSGSAEAKLRTLRAGACLRSAEGKQFLSYGYFSTATPSAMARSFQALDCDYAMLMDMNALEHTYAAVYVRKNNAIQTQHLVSGMSAVDKRQSDGSRIPRFIGFSDNRDFFYITRREVKK